MIRSFLFVLFIFFSLNTHCQEWIRIYGNGQNPQVRYVIEDYDKGYDILGMINNYKYLWLIKTSVNGNILWDRKIGNGIYTNWAGNIEKTLDGGYIICGTWTKFNPSYDAFIIKLNACAEVEWCKTLITPTNYDMGLRVKPTPEGDYVLLGAYFMTDPISNVSLFKFNPTGDLIWHQFYPMDSIYYDDQPQDLVTDDGYLISSARYYPDSGTVAPKIIRHYFVKTDTAGNQIWELVYGANKHFYGWPWAAKKSMNGSYYEAGNHINVNGNGSPAFVKVLKNGVQSYHSDVLSGMYWGGLSSIDFLYDSLIVMVGGWTINDTTHDVFFKTDTLGNVKKIKELPRLSHSYWSTAKTFDNKFITVGMDAYNPTWKIYAVKVNSDLEYDSIYTKPFTYDSLCPHPIVSGTVDPVCNNVYVGIEEPFKNPETTKLKIFPNPASDHLTVEMPKYLVVSNTSGKIPSTTIYHQWGSVLLEIYDLFGKKILEKQVVRSETLLEIDVSPWPAGIYLCRLTFNKQTVGSAKVVVE